VRFGVEAVAAGVELGPPVLGEVDVGVVVVDAGVQHRHRRVRPAGVERPPGRPGVHLAETVLLGVVGLGLDDAVRGDRRRRPRLEVQVYLLDRLDAREVGPDVDALRGPYQDRVCHPEPPEDRHAVRATEPLDRSGLRL
jgi:hypothetical protein